MKTKAVTLIEGLVVFFVGAILLAIIVSAVNRTQTDITKNAAGQFVETTFDDAVTWTKKHPAAKVVSMSETTFNDGMSHRLTIVYEEPEPKPESEK